MKVAVVGASGFVGEAVCDRLSARGATVVKVSAPRMKVDLTLDLRDQVTAFVPNALDSLDFNGADVIVNCAGDPDTTSRDRAALYAANATLPLMIGRIALVAGARRFVHVSSAVVQGRRPTLDATPAKMTGLSPYADSKTLGESLLQELPTGFGVVYRPPSVHAPGRRITRGLATLARRGLGVVAGKGEAPSPQALLPNVADAVAELALSSKTPPEIVNHPWEGQTTSTLLQNLGGRDPRHVPAPLARTVIATGYAASSLIPGLRLNIRRAELMLLGQAQDRSWLTEMGWKPLVGTQGWSHLALDSGRNEPTVLIVASVASMIDQFNLPNIELLQKLGASVEVACNFDEGNTISPERTRELQEYLESTGVAWHQIDFSRHPHKVMSHLRAFRQLWAVSKDSTPQFIHSHSPIGGAISRAVGHLQHIPNIYTVHGFHFMHGGTTIGWLLYSPLERLLAPLTHTVVTVNAEDTTMARKLGAKRVVRMPGVGIDLTRFQIDPATRRIRREELGLAPDTPCILSVGELNSNKNHAAALQALSSVDDLDWHYVICGQGRLLNDLQSLAKTLDLVEKVTFTGYRSDVASLYTAADIFLFPSRREGMPVSVLEAMASGLPIIAPRIRGVVDLVEDGSGGLLTLSCDPDAFAKSIRQLLSDPTLAAKMGRANRETVKAYSLDRAMAVIKPTYSLLLGIP